MLELSTQLSSDETLDGQANDDNKKSLKNQEAFFYKCALCSFCSNIIFYLVNLKNYGTQNPIP